MSEIISQSNEVTPEQPKVNGVGGENSGSIVQTPPQAPNSRKKWLFIIGFSLFLIVIFPLTIFLGLNIFNRVNPEPISGESPSALATPTRDDSKDYLIIGDITIKLPSDGGYL